ncbi:MAG: hypothetical protein GXZ11_05145 [Tissierellia bacterium]|nr:hypothetical protein [Tissierellia bacterium]
MDESNIFSIQKTNFSTLSSNVPSTFNMTWLEGGFNTDYRKEGVISGDGNTSLDITPFDNEKMRSAIYQLNFTMGGDRDAAPGEIEIRIPMHIFFGRAGEPVDSIKIPLLQAPQTEGATAFHYNMDEENSVVVLTNYETFLRTESFTTAIQYDFWPYQVADGYTNPDIDATLLIKQGGELESIDTTSNKINVTVHSNSKLIEITKQPVERIEGWNSEWGEKPADADEYFYYMWRISMKKPQNNTQPYSVKYVDVADPVGDIVAFSNTQVHWVVNNPSSWTLNEMESNGLDKFNNKVFYSEANPKNYSYDTKITTHIITKYKKDLAVDGKRFNNNITANLTGVDGASDTKIGKSYFTYKPPAEYSGDYYYANKSTDGYINKEGLLNALEKELNIKPLGFKNYTFSIRAEGSRMRNISEEGNSDYTIEVVDNIMGLRQYEINGKPKDPWFELLTPNDDFKYLNFYIQYTEYNEKYNITNGYSRVEATDYINYRPVELYVQQGENSEWNKLGEFLRTGKEDYNYKFTDINGNVTSSVYNSRPISLPADTTNIKMVYRGSRYSVSMAGFFGVQINPTDKVRAAIEKIKGVGEEVLNFYNISTMAIKDSSGNLVNENNESQNGEVTNIMKNSPEARARILAQAKALGAKDEKLLQNGVTYLDLRWLNVSSYLSKTGKVSSSDVANGREIIDYTIRMGEGMFQNRGVISEQQAEEWNLVAEQNSGIFYDLLPRGTWALKDTIKVNTIDYYSNGYGGVISTKGKLCTNSVEFFPDWRGSGMTMMKLTVKAPMEHNIKNISTTSGTYFMFSGFIVDFSVANPWDNILDNGKTAINTVAYETGEGVLAKGLPDINPSTSIQEKQWFEDVNGNNDEDNFKFLYAQNKLDLNPIIVTEIGFTKKVKSLDEPTFGVLSEVPVAGEYIYRLRYTVNKNTQSKNVIIYDILENAFGENIHWQGAFNRIDLSAATSKHIAPVVYYSTRNDLNPRDNFSDGDLTDENIWTKTQPIDKKQIKAIAIDLSKNTSGSDYVFPAESVLPIYVYMDAPKGGVPNTAPPIYAYNESFIRGTNVVGSNVDVDLNEKTDVVRVFIRDIDMSIEKTSTPETGTVDNPKDIRENDNKLVYRIRVNDNSSKDVARDVVVDDIIPTGLVVDE